MTHIAAFMNGLMAALDGWTVGVLTSTVADIEAAASKTIRRLS